MRGLHHHKYCHLCPRRSLSGGPGLAHRGGGRRVAPGQVSSRPHRPASTDTSEVDEWDVDTQYSTGIADRQGNATLYIYDATSLSDSDTARAFNKFVTQDAAKAGSAVFSACEAYPYLDGAMLLDDEVFADSATQGRTVFSSSGDTGGACAVAPTNGVPMSGPPQVNYPVASPYAVAVGGTTLLTNSNGSYAEKLAWTGSGGGTRDFESAPYRQSGVVPATTTVGQGVPDMAMDADPESGANVYIDGTPAGVPVLALSLGNVGALRKC